MAEPTIIAERQLQLILAIDAVRDKLRDDGNPQTMFQSLASLLKYQFEADASAITVFNDKTHQPEAVAAASLPPDMAINLCQEAMSYATPTPIAHSIWPYTIGFQIILDEDGPPMGGIFLGRRSRPFDDVEITLLKLAESQIDSAVLQARVIWKLAQRNRELEMIYQIDRLRDTVRDELALINGVTALVLEAFRATLCMVALSSADSGEFVVQGIVDKKDLPPTVLEEIRSITQDLQFPQTIPTPSGIDESLHLLGAPFHVMGEQLGALVVGRAAEFGIDDVRLMHAIVSQLDSAIVHFRTQQQLANRKLELEIIYRIDRIRDQVHDFDSMLQNVLVEICRAISSEMGYLMLYNAEKEDALELKAWTKSNLLTVPEFSKVIKDISREALDAAQLVYNNNPVGPIRSLIAIPLILNDRIIGVFGALNSEKVGGFDVEDRRMLTAITSQVDTAVFERLERRRMREVLSRSVDPKVLEALLQRADDSILIGERVVISMLFADLRGSTEWAEHTDPEEFVSILNQFLGTMTDIIFAHGGTLDKYVGDEIIALFGTPVPMDDHPYFAALTALEMQEAHRRLQAELEAQGKFLPPMGIGISTGEVIAGEFGPPMRTDFTAMGRMMNLGARLCSAAEAHQVIISPNTYEMLGPRARVKALEPIVPKGIAKPIQIYQLNAVAPND